MYQISTSYTLIYYNFVYYTSIKLDNVQIFTKKNLLLIEVLTIYFIKILSAYIKHIERTTYRIYLEKFF